MDPFFDNLPAADDNAMSLHHESFWDKEESNNQPASSCYGSLSRGEAGRGQAQGGGRGQDHCEDHRRDIHHRDMHHRDEHHRDKHRRDERGQGTAEMSVAGTTTRTAGLCGYEMGTATRYYGYAHFRQSAFRTLKPSSLV
jgi:hypothetical protein